MGEGVAAVKVTTGPATTLSFTGSSRSPAMTLSFTGSCRSPAMTLSFTGSSRSHLQGPLGVLP